jgi:alpha-beta hydrolase superfamily lysophospholipase
MGSTMRPGMAAVGLAATLAAAAPTPADAPDLVLKTRTFLPGKDVVVPYGENYIYTPTAAQNGRLLILFPGASPGRYKSFMTAAAAHGYHVLGLDSPLTAVHKGDDACQPPADCYRDLLRQAVEGDLVNRPPFFARDHPQARYPQGKNALMHRLVAILEYLKEHKQGSGQFLLCRDAEACEPDWPKLVLAGHSSGAAVALWLIQHHHGTGMKALLSSPPAVPGLDPAGAPWKGDVRVLDGADCPGLEDGDAERCAWDRLLPPY